jgi:4-oxalomesaconate hydratase
MNDYNINLMVFSAHAADFCSRCGGTLAKYSKNGANVKVIDLTYGERGESSHLWKKMIESNKEISTEEVKKIREREARNAAKILGVEIHFMNFDDYPLIINKDRIITIVEEIRSFKPDIILTHWPNDPTNPDHSVTSKLVLKACAYATAIGLKTKTKECLYPKIFFFEPAVPTTEITGFKPDIYIDITDVFDIKIEALKKFEAQPFLSEWYTLYAKYRGFQASFILKNVKYAEAFKRFYPTVGNLLL